MQESGSVVFVIVLIFFSVSFQNLKPKGEREIFSELLTKSHDEISAKMTKWKIPSRHLQSWLIGSKSAKNYTGSMGHKKIFF